MNLGTRKLLLGAIAALIVIGGVAVVLASRGGGSSGSSCTSATNALERHIASRPLSAPGLDARKVTASLEACPYPEAWRLAAHKAGIAASLGRLLDNNAETTDLALDALCTHFDGYTRTPACKNRDNS